MRNRTDEINKKNFDSKRQIPIDFGRIKVGKQTLNDATLNLGSLKRTNSQLANKTTVLKAIDSYDLKTMRDISDFFYKTSGIYARILRYMAFMYRFDWYLTPIVKEKDLKEKDKRKLITDFKDCLSLLDNFNVKKTLGEISLKVLKNGCYYGYKVDTAQGMVLQELPVNYCRSRFNYGAKPVVEFNMKFFDENFRDSEQKQKVLKMFPHEFAVGYRLYKEGKLPPQFSGDDRGWYLLDPAATAKFAMNDEDYPAFISVVPLILDLDEAQDLDRKKTLQRLLKILVQKMPMDKNGDLIFDMEEAQQLHNNAVRMLGSSIGIDVLTTFADVAVEDLTDSNAATSQSDDLQRVERQLYNEAGVSQNQFNASGNLALTNSILNDAATMYNMLLQFEIFLNELISEFNKKSDNIRHRVQLLTTTIYNYQELAKLYKEQTQLGYSKMLPQIALGQLQSTVLANAYFENDVLDLVNTFIPPFMSSTMNEQILTKMTDGEVGRKEKSDAEKSDKTIANRESMG